MVGDNIYWRGGALEIVSPMLESIKNCHELFVMDIIIELGTSEGVSEKQQGEVHLLRFALILSQRECNLRHRFPQPRVGRVPSVQGLELW